MSITLQFVFEIDGVATDVTSAVLSDATGAYGVKRNDTGAAVVADGTAMTRTATGTYEYSFTPPADGLTYTWAVEYVHDGTTYRDTHTYADTTKVITVTEVKDVLHLSDTDNDTLLNTIIDAATKWAEEYLGRKFLTQTCVDYHDHWPALIRPDWSPLIAVTSIQYVDSAGATQTWSSDDYDVDTDSEPGRIAPAYGESYPTIRGDQNGIIVTYTAGYGTDAEDVPAHYRHALMLLVSHWFFHPESLAAYAIPPAVKAMLGIGRLVNV